MMHIRPLYRLCLPLCVVLAGCAGSPAPDTVPGPAPLPRTDSAPSAPVPAPARPGGFYLDDGPGDSPLDEASLAAIPDAQPRDEALHRFANRPYSALGMDFVPMTERKPFHQRGRGSWYGRKFHGQKTASGEPYDMYGMTAAHATLPIPSYVRVTNLSNGRSVVVRVNDRGPFKPGRVIDLSWTAAAKLGYVAQGSTEVSVEAVFPQGSPADLLARRAAGAPESRRTPPPEPDDAIAALADDTADRPGIWLQLGAFSALDNAQALRGRVAQSVADLADRLLVLSDGSHHRLHAGPFENRDAAMSAAQALRERLGVDALLISR
jgi:rare lipoprotein A